MRYDIEFRPRAIRDLDGLSPEVARRVLLKVDAMRDDLAGDVKRLRGLTAEYRLRVGNYRVLFEIDASRLVIHRVRHRREAYD